MEVIRGEIMNWFRARRGLRDPRKKEAGMSVMSIARSAVCRLRDPRTEEARSIDWAGMPYKSMWFKCPITTSQSLWKHIGLKIFNKRPYSSRQYIILLPTSGSTMTPSRSGHDHRLAGVPSHANTHWGSSVLAVLITMGLLLCFSCIICPRHLSASPHPNS